jgi:hypothetical protein
MVFFRLVGDEARWVVVTIEDPASTYPCMILLITDGEATLLDF